MTDGITITGGWQLTGQFVAVMIAGLDCGNFQIDATGATFVPFGSDPDGLMTPGYLNAVSDASNTDPSYASLSITNGSGETIVVYVPVLIGYAYSSRGQLLRPATEQQTKAVQGAAFGTTRRLHRFAMQLISAIGLAVGTRFDRLDAVLFRDSGDNILTHDVPFTGIYQGDITDSSSVDGQICWEISRPYPCTITAVAGFLETQER